METKQVKKFSIAMFFVAFALMIAAVFAMPAVVHATEAPKSSSSTLTLNYSKVNYNIASNDAGSYIIIPSSNATSVVATAANAAKTKATIDDITAAEPKMFLVGNVSNYNIVYSLEDANGNVASETINIDLEEQDASFKFESNVKEIIPTIVQKSQENKIVFPYPFIYVGEESDTPINYGDAGRPADCTGLTVTLTSPKGTTIPISKNSDGYYEYQVKKDGDNETQLGKYTLRYTYKSATTQTVVKTFGFTVKDGAVEQAIKIDKFSSALPSSMALFVETNLPKPVVVNTKNANTEVSAYSKIYLEFTPSSGSAEGKTIYTNDLDKKTAEGYTYTSSLNDFKFTPTVAGTFTLTYKVFDFFGNEAQTSSEINAIIARKTAESGSGYIVEPYADFAAEKTLIESGKFKTAEYQIPSRVKVGTSTGDTLPAEELWQLPAIFGIDKLTTDSSSLNYERIVRYTNSKNQSIKITFISSSSEEQPANSVYTQSGTYKADANNAIPFRFTEEADYTVEYIVRDASQNTLFDKTYTVKAEKDYADTTNPTVKFEGLNTTSVIAGKVLKFKVSAQDTESATSSKAADDRLNVEVTAKVGDADAQTIYADENGYYEFSTAGIADGTPVIIKAKATDDYGLFDEQQKTVVVKVISTSTVPTAGNFNFDSSWSIGTVEADTLDPVYSGTTVVLPAITFTGANKNLEVKITAKVDSNKVFERTLNSGNDAQVVLCGGEEFVVSRSGDYVVNYVAKDLSGNKAVKSFVFKVIGPETTIINLGSFESKYEFGSEINLRNLTVTLQTDAGSEDITDDCKLITGISSTATDAEIRTAAQTAAAEGCAILCQIIGDYSLTDDESIIKAGQNGSVTINYWAVGHWTNAADFDRNFGTEGEKHPSTVSFTVKDETKPTIYVNETLIDDVVPYDSSKTGTYDNMVKIADVTKVWDLAGIQEDSLKITARYSTSSKDVDMIVINGKLTTATDVLYIGNEKVKIGDKEYTYDAAAGTLNDGTTTYTFVNNKVTIDEVEYTLAPETDYYGYFKAGGNGTVTVTYSATDNNGNTETKTFSIVVGDVTPPEINAETVKSAVESASYQKGNTVSINLKDLKIIDDVSTLTYSDVKVTVTRDGEAIDIDTTDPEKVSFTVDDYGTYVVSFDVKDAAGYSAPTEKVSFSVSNNNQGKTTSSTTVWGTVLIVVILVALGVIIFLFAKPSKSKQTVKLTDKKNDDKKE